MFQKLLDKLNNLSPKQLLAMAGVAAVLMFGAIYAGMTLLAENNKPIQPPPEETKVVEKVAVVVAKTSIHPRTRIQENMLQIKELPKEIVPEGAIKSFNEVLNVQVKVTIFAGDVLTNRKVFAESSDEGFTGSIPADCRAVSISVNDITSVAGFAKPGDHVDLLFVEKGKYSATTELLLQNVLLLSVNQDMGGAVVGENVTPSAAISNPSIATFALRPREVLKLISAIKIGEIYMSLRPSKPQNAYLEHMEYTFESMDAPRPEPVREPAPAIPSNPLPQIPVAPAEPAVPPTPKIEIISGDQVVQSATPTLPAGGPINQPNQPTFSQPLPAIPSRSVPQEFSAPVVPHVPLADSPVSSH